MKRLWMRFLAYMHWSDSAVCAMSKEARDYHDYPDSTTPEPWHFFTHTCARCRKRFTI